MTKDFAMVAYLLNGGASLETEVTVCSDGRFSFRLSLGDVTSQRLNPYRRRAAEAHPSSLAQA